MDEDLIELYFSCVCWWEEILGGLKMGRGNRQSACSLVRHNESGQLHEHGDSPLAPSSDSTNMALHCCND